MSASAVSSPEAPAAALAANPPALVAAVQELHLMAAKLLSEPASDPLWLDRLRALAQRLQSLQTQAPDGVLYLLFYGAARTIVRYSSHHALVCAAVARACAQTLRCPEAETHSLALAALTMNLSITGLQDELVFRERTPTLDQRVAIDTHAARSAELLAELGVTDALWLGVVAQHHAAPAPADALQAPDAVQRLAQLLRRIDVLTAKMSPRKTRKGLPPTQAVRDAYLARGGAPDEIGAAITKAIGIYPPGSLVTLANGETAIVLRQGARASQPLVASLIGADRQALSPALVRDTAIDGQQIRAVARADELRGRVDHEQLLAAAAGAGPR